MTLGASWKTSASGISGAASTVLLLFAGFVSFASGAPYHVLFPGWVQALSGFIGVTGGLGLAGSIASLGLAAKDHNVTGGDISQFGLVAVADPKKLDAVVAAVAQPVMADARTRALAASAPIVNLPPARPAQPVVASPTAIRW